jgi:hypothetical protein
MDIGVVLSIQIVLLTEKVLLLQNLVNLSIFFSVALRPNAGHGLLILEISRSHTTTHHSR